MAFDDSTGGIDRLQYRNQQDVYGNDFGDGKPKRLFEASRTCEERREVDSEKRAEYLARRAKIAADATRRRSAPVEAKIQAERIAQSKTVMGAAMRAALDKRDRRNGRERPEKAER
jgi:hypothetical protein